ncbi:MAG: tetratricopeptide repeat protein, partial [Pseudomonadota bacterium]
MAHNQDRNRTIPLLPVAAIAASLLALTPVHFASAAGSGGGGGGGAPSASAPQYDPAKEYREGIAALNAEDYSVAIKHFRRVTKAAKRNPEGHYMLGLSYLRKGDAKKARKPLEKAIKYNPEMIAAHRDLAIAYVELDQTEDARGVLTALSERREACGDTCAAKAELDQAVQAVEAALSGEAQARLGPDLRRLADAAYADRLYYEAVGAINQGRFDQALHRLDEAALAFGPHPDILTYQGFANRKLARFGTAHSYYTSALTIAPDHYGAL